MGKKKEKPINLNELEEEEKMTIKGRDLIFHSLSSFRRDWRLGGSKTAQTTACGIGYFHTHLTIDE